MLASVFAIVWGWMKKFFGFQFDHATDSILHGDPHFENAETWTVLVRGGLQMFLTAIHRI